MVTAGRPYYARLADIDLARAHREVDEHLRLTLHVAREAIGKVRPGGTLLFMTGTDARRPDAGGPIVSALTAGLPALTVNLALELAPVRIDLIVAASSTRPCRHYCSAISSTSAATSSAPRSRSAVSSDPPTSPHSRSTS